VHSVGIAVLCLSIYFMYDFSKSQHNRCCLCCTHLWTRFCSMASKQAIDDNQSAVRELCWILHGETCAELEDISEKKDTEMKRRRSSKLMPTDLGQISHESQMRRTSVRNSKRISTLNHFQPVIITPVPASVSMGVPVLPEQTPPPPPVPPHQESAESEDMSLPLGVTMRMEQWYQNEPGASTLSVFERIAPVAVSAVMDSPPVPMQMRDSEIMEECWNHDIDDPDPESREGIALPGACGVTRGGPDVNNGHALRVNVTRGGPVHVGQHGHGVTVSIDIETPDIELGPGNSGSVPFTPQSSNGTMSARL